MRSRALRAVGFVVAFLLTAGFDQGSKTWARETLTPGQPVAVIDGVWDWQLAHNTGAAFSSFAGHGVGAQIALSALALVALIAIGVAAARTRPEQRLERVALALIGGGALGNLVDRLRDGAVTDFVRWRWNAHAWPIFNVADVALVIGVALLAIAGLRARGNRPAPA